MDDIPQMPLDAAQLEKLKCLSEQYKREAKAAPDKSLWALIGDIHNQELLRWWVTLESVSLMPVVTKVENGQYLIHQLLSVPESANSGKLRPPWAYIAWTWPARQLVRMEAIQHWPSLPKTEFSRELVLTRQAANMLEQELKDAGSCPKPPSELTSFFSAIAPSFPWGAPTASAQNAFAQAAPSTGTTFTVSAFSSSAHGAISKLAEEMRSILLASAHPQEIRTLERLLSRLDSGNFTIAVVGEFGRGKSTLINKLLDGEYLPTSRSPIPPFLARVRYAQANMLVLNRTGTPPVSVALTPAIWEQLECEVGQTHLGMAEIGVANEWLRASGLLLFDTPSANTGNAEHAATTMEVLATADAAIMVTSALAPLGISEREFIAQHIEAHLVPRIAVVITHLDQIPENERSSVVNYTALQLNKWAPAAILGTTFEQPTLPGNSPLAFAGIVQLRALIERWTTDADHRGLAKKQVTEGLQKMAKEGIARLNIRKQTLMLSDEGRAELRQKASVTIEKTRLDWEDVKLEFRNREIAVGDLMESELLSKKEGLVDRLSYALRACREPLAWWRDDLPFLLRQELGRLGREAQVALERKIAEDFRWLQNCAKGIYGENLASTSVEVGLPFDVRPEVKSQDLPDLQKSRQHTRLAVGGVTIAAYALFGPLGSVVSLAGGVVSENYFKKQLDGQKQRAVEQLGPFIERLLRNAVAAIRARVGTIYNDIGVRIKDEGDKWLKMTSRTLFNPSNGEAAPELAALDEQTQRWNAISVRIQSLNS